MKIRSPNQGVELVTHSSMRCKCLM